MIWEHPFGVLPQDDDGQMRSRESALQLESAIGTMSSSETNSVFIKVRLMLLF